jgi:hypothetical protein
MKEEERDALIEAIEEKHGILSSVDRHDPMKEQYFALWDTLDNEDSVSVAAVSFGYGDSMQTFAVFSKTKLSPKALKEWADAMALEEEYDD